LDTGRFLNSSRTKSSPDFGQTTAADGFSLTRSQHSNEATVTFHSPHPLRLLIPHELGLFDDPSQSARICAFRLEPLVHSEDPPLFICRAAECTRSSRPAYCRLCRSDGNVILNPICQIFSDVCLFLKPMFPPIFSPFGGLGQGCS
jgi:hypothetical protein